MFITITNGCFLFQERESFRLKRQQLEQQHAAKMNQERAALAVKERDIKLERDKQDMSEAEWEMTRLVRRQHSNVPPPPPPVSIQHCQNVLQYSHCLLYTSNNTHCSTLISMYCYKHNNS